ncbi:MAG: hypothetical protein KC561_19570, partial [Myxococcales bacterium]|nr:hypothetical protein [Myxococcales bacterium]
MKAAAERGAAIPSTSEASDSVRDSFSSSLAGLPVQHQLAEINPDRPFIPNAGSAHLGTQSGELESGLDTAVQFEDGPTGGDNAAPAEEQLTPEKCREYAKALEAKFAATKS